MTPCDCCGSAEWLPLFAENDIWLGKCPHCDLHSIDSVPDPEARMTEMEAGHYAATESVLGARQQRRAEEILTALFQRYVDLAAPLVPNGTWLDIGCGSGHLIGLAQQAGYLGQGLELNSARRADAVRQTGAQVHAVPIEAVGLPDDSVEVISMINTFSHLTSPTQTLAELRRILKPGGILILATGEMTDTVEKSHLFNWNLGDHLYFLGDRTIKEYAARLDFEIVEHRRRWLPDEMFCAEWLQVKGRSRAKNAVKTAVRFTPGGLVLLRAVMFRRQADSKAHSSILALRPVK